MNFNDYKIPETYGVSFEITYINVGDHYHRVATAGNPTGIPVIVMMGVFEDSLADSRWLVASMVNHEDGKKFKFIIINVPFLEEYTEIKLSKTLTSKYDGFIPPNKIVKMKGTKFIDPRFDLENCAYTLRSILIDGLKITKAHFIGHDRGCIIMDNMLAEFPEMAISYSRGSQGWINFKKEWMNLTKKGIFLGPPHRIMATKVFQKLLSNAIKGGVPFGFISPSFAIDAHNSKLDSDIRSRWLAIQNMPNQSKKFFKLTRQMFRQTDFLDEGTRRTDKSRGFCIIDTDFPMMQFQGSDEMILAKNIKGAKKLSFSKKISGLLGFRKVSGIFKLFRLRFPTYSFANLPEDFGFVSNHTGDQPYWGKWNFWAGEVEDLYPNGEFQDRTNPIWIKNYKKFVVSHRNGMYSTLQTKKEGRFNRFVIVSKSLHWTHIERPENVAYACLDFINDVEKKLI